MENFDPLGELLKQFDSEDIGTQPVAMLQKLVAGHWDDLPFPGQADTLGRRQRLSLVASHDLSLAKLY